MIDTVLSEGQHFFETNLPGLYKEEHFIEGVAVTSPASNKAVGVILMIAPTDQIQGLLKNTTAIFFYVWRLRAGGRHAGQLSFKPQPVPQPGGRHQGRHPLRRGDLEARVPVGGRNTIEMDELAQAFNTMAESLAKSRPGGRSLWPT